MKSLSCGTVILVDDDPLVRDCTARLLGECGLDVLPFAGGHEALARLRAEPADVVLSDIRMPGLSGMELLEKMRALDAETPVILMTAFADLEVAVSAIRKGVFDFILKPFTPFQLSHSVQKAVDFRRLRQLEKNYQAELERRVEEATRELRATHERVVQGEKMASIGQLAAGVAHEINNPVGFILSNLTTLTKYAERLDGFIRSQAEAIAAHCPGAVRADIEEQRRRFKLDHILEDIQPLIAESLEGAARVTKLVQSLKTFSRIDASEFTQTDIHEGIESTLTIVWNEIKYVATVKKEYGEIPRTKAYPQQLNQVFMNLLVNAAHAMDKPGEITIRTWCDEEAIFIAVSDTGCGIPKENLGRIFEPFFTTKESGKGTGLGLSITCDIVKKHGGEISVESEQGRGTTFTLKLPVVPA